MESIESSFESPTNSSKENPMENSLDKSCFVRIGDEFKEFGDYPIVTIQCVLH